MSVPEDLSPLAHRILQLLESDPEGIAVIDLVKRLEVPSADFSLAIQELLHADLIRVSSAWEAVPTGV